MVRRAREVIEKQRPQVASYDLTLEEAGDDGLVCGGRMEVFIEPIEGEPTLCLFGAGHVAVPLARMAKAAGFRVEVVDDRARFASSERFPDADLVLVDDFAGAAARMTLGPNSYAVVVTRGHKGDVDALHAVLGRGLRFVGLLSSKAKMVHVANLLRERGVSAEEVASVHAPLGLAIGAVTPEEIAVSVLAEMIAVRRGVDPARAGSLKMELPGRLAAPR
jgi:xanthine dehydrogenase accessory factor